MEDIKQFRNEIDEIDGQLTALFCKRMQVSEKVAEYKKSKGLPVLDTTRERELLNKIHESVGEEFGQYARILYNTIMSLSRSYQSKKLQNDTPLIKSIENAIENTPHLFPQKAKVACQGIEGAYSQKACDKLFILPSVEFVPTFENVFEKVENGECEYGIVPLENSTAGSVNQTYNLLTKHDFYIVRSLKMQINHSLLAPKGTKIEDVKEIFSHEQAINQCSEFIRSLKGVKVTVCANTAISAQKVASMGRKDVCAIASSDCASAYGLDIIKNKIANTDNNFTKFICISKNLQIYPGANRTSIVLSTPNRPGALYGVLSRLTALGINVIKLESRPIEGRDFEFAFYFDLDVSVYSPSFLQLISEMERDVDGFRYFGSYSEN